MYENSCEIMYKMISKRFALKRLLLNKENSEIYKGEENLMSAIANNRRHPKKNRYLIPADITNAHEPKDYVVKIAKALEFEKPRDFLWGERKEIELYAGYLFANLIKDAINDEKPDTVNQIYDVLADYIPYAKSKFYCDLVNEFGADVVRRVEIEFDNSDDYPNMLDKAIARIYSKVKPTYIETLKDFLYCKQSTHKLDRAFSYFVKKLLLPILQKAITDPSISNYAKIMLKECYSFIKKDLTSIGFAKHITYQVVTLSMTTIKKFIDIQKNDERPFNLDCIKNKWLTTILVEDFS